jgi:Mu-like prophage I protein
VKQRDPIPTAERPRASRGPVRAAPVNPSAAADIDRVVEQYCNMIIDKGPGDPEFWFWPRSAWVDPNQLIVDGENGSLYRVEFTTNAQQEATFSDPIETLETFTDLAPSAKAAVLAAARQDTKSPAVMRVYGSRGDLPVELPTPSNSGGSEGVGDTANNVGMTPEQLKALGLAEDATPEQINARIAELRALEDAAAGDGNGSGEQPGDGNGGSGEGEGEGAPAGDGAAAPAASAGPRPGMVEVPADQWESVQQGAAAGAQVAQDNELRRRDDTISAATAKGKISPAAKQSMENLHQRDPDAFYKLLTASVADGGLQEGLIPVNQRGSAGGGEVAASSAEVTPAKMAALFPEVAIPGGNA